jgi:glycerol kinase
MSKQKFVLALDSGTTSCRAIVFAHNGSIVSTAQQEIQQFYPRPGEVEHDPEEIWERQLAVAQDALRIAEIGPDQVAAIGITNQRETTILWERSSGRPIGKAIVWQSRVSAPICAQLKADGLEPLIREKTGLVIDAYFSGTKIKHLLDQNPGLRSAAERGEILFGTVDCYLLWRLSGGKLHITDVSNASRTMLLNIQTLAWDPELLRILNVPRAMLPDVRPNSAVYGETAANLFGAPIPLSGAAGDQQAATFGQACFQPGSAKNTYGTGCFLLLNTGPFAIPSRHGLLTTVGWQIGGKTTYCLEGAVFIAGAAVQWLRDELQIIKTSSEIEELAAQVPDNGGVYFVPALVGLGAPYWDPNARGTIVGLTRGSNRSHLARAALEAMAFQTRDILDAMQDDAGIRLNSLKVDGGATVNNLLMQFQADILGTPVMRPVVRETTALGAAYLAGLAVGYWESQDDIIRNWALDREFSPSLPGHSRDHLYRIWQRATERARHWVES